MVDVPDNLEKEIKSKWIFGTTMIGIHSRMKDPCGDGKLFTEFRLYLSMKEVGICQSQDPVCRDASACSVPAAVVVVEDDDDDDNDELAS